MRILVARHCRGPYNAAAITYAEANLLREFHAAADSADLSTEDGVIVWRLAGKPPSELVALHEHECSNDAAAATKARGLCNGHNVEVWEGSRWVATIKDTKETRAALQRSVPNASCGKDLGMALAVVVEDEWAIRLEISDTLTQAGWELLEFASGEQAIEFLSKRCQVSLLVTDIRLTGVLSGWDVAEAFRSANPGLVVYYCSANAAEGSRHVPDSVFMRKPCRMDRLPASAA